MSNGTSGDINNINFAGAAPKGQAAGEQIRVVAYDVADTALEAYKKIIHKADVSLDAAVAEIELGVRLPDEKDLRAGERRSGEGQGPRAARHGRGLRPRDRADGEVPGRR